MIRLFLVLAFTLAVALPAHADTADGWKAYKAGDYVTARDLFEADGSADGLAAACRTGLVLGGFYEDGKASVHTLHRALDDCKAALDLDQGQIDARISYAIGLAFEGKRLKKAKYAKAARQLLEDMKVVADNYGILHAALGGWHTSVHEAGFFARLALGAKRPIARDHFLTALERAPEDIGVRFEFIKYLAFGKADEQAEAVAQIARLDGLAVRDAFDRFLLARAKDIGAMIEVGDRKGLEAALHRATAFADIRDEKDLPGYPLEDD